MQVAADACVLRDFVHVYGCNSSSQHLPGPPICACLCAKGFDHPDAGLAHWDCYWVARLDAFKPLAATGSDNTAGPSSTIGGSMIGNTSGSSSSSSGKAARVQHATHSAAKLPLSFSNINAKEERLLAYVDEFQRLFRELYPHRQATLAKSTASYWHLIHFCAASKHASSCLCVVCVCGGGEGEVDGIYTSHSQLYHGSPGLLSIMQATTASDAIERMQCAQVCMQWTAAQPCATF